MLTEIVPRFIICVLAIKLQKKVNTMIVFYNLSRMLKEWGMVCIISMSINVMVFWDVPSLLVVADFKVLLLQFTEETEKDKNHSSSY